jgi:mannose/fructose/N-acetylgalactosamine-specific phosphotransferase system component IIC
MSALLAAVAGGIVGLDGTSFPQAMISRPLVAGALAGWLAGMPAEGAFIGAVIEAFHLAILPIGAARYPEAGTATVAATFGYAWAAPADAGAGLLLTLVFALIWERLTGASVTLQRRINEVILAARGGVRTARGVEMRHIGAMAVDFARAALATVAGAAIGWLWLDVVVPFWTLGPAPARGLVLAAAAGVAAAVLRVFGGWTERWKLFVAGAASGLLVLLIR